MGAACKYQWHLLLSRDPLFQGFHMPVPKSLRSSTAFSKVSICLCRRVSESETQIFHRLLTPSSQRIDDERFPKRYNRMLILNCRLSVPLSGLEKLPLGSYPEIFSPSQKLAKFTLLIFCRQPSQCRRKIRPAQFEDSSISIDIVPDIL